MRYILLLTICTAFTLSVFSQIKSKSAIPKSYSISAQRPILFTSGDTIVVQCDSIYLMNSKRYAFYKSIHEVMLSHDDSVYGKLLRSYELNLSEHENTYERLFSNLNQSDKITFDLVNTTQESLANAQKNISQVQVKLDSSLKKLELANSYIKEERRKSRNQKLIAGFGGVGLGFIVGVLIMK